MRLDAKRDLFRISFSKTSTVTGVNTTLNPLTPLSPSLICFCHLPPRRTAVTVSSIHDVL